MKKIKVSMIRGKIREKNTTKKVLQSLGLKKIGQSRTYNYNDAVMGMVKKVIHMVSYEIFEEKAEKKVTPKKQVVKTPVEKKVEAKKAIDNGQLTMDNSKEVKKEKTKGEKPKEEKTIDNGQLTIDNSKEVKKEKTKSEKSKAKKTIDSSKEEKKEVKKPVEKKVVKVTDEKPKAKKTDGGKDETQ